MIVVAHSGFFAKNHLLFPVLLAQVLFAVFLTKFSVLSFVTNKMFWVRDVCWQNANYGYGVVNVR